MITEHLKKVFWIILDDLAINSLSSLPPPHTSLFLFLSLYFSLSISLTNTQTHTHILDGTTHMHRASISKHSRPDKYTQSVIVNFHKEHRYTVCMYETQHSRNATSLVMPQQNWATFPSYLTECDHFPHPVYNACTHHKTRWCNMTSHCITRSCLLKIRDLASVVPHATCYKHMYIHVLCACTYGTRQNHETKTPNTFI